MMNNKEKQVYCTFQDAPQHTFPGHPESPHRLHLMREWITDPPYPEMVWLDFEPAPEADVLLVHSKAMLESIKAACRMGPHEFEPSPSYVTEDSCLAAFGAVGATLAVSRRILADGHGRGFAIVRPPGHHAEPDQPMGFCLLNNIAIAAADAVASGVGKVAIIDFDAHHGNGTQAAFWQSPQVGYLSTHEMNIYPGSGRIESAPHARGRIINIPLPPFSDTHAFLDIFHGVAAPWLRNFGAEMLLVSAGFDPHFSDPLTTLTLDTAGFFRITQMLADLAEEFCQGRILFVLEGGYDPLALRDNIQACLSALCGHSSYPDHYGRSPGGRSEVKTIIEKLQNLHHIKED
jgi:acetoin utilization deacetylase AcuC-like enzyme